MSKLISVPASTQALGTERVITIVDSVSSYADVITANYLSDQQAAGHVFYPTDQFLISYVGGQGMFTPSIDNNGVITLFSTLQVANDYNKVIGLSNVLLETAGTWTMTRVAQGNYALVHTVANNTSIIGFDITDAIRTAAGAGLKLTSIDVMHSIGVANLDAHSMTLQSVAYANGVAVAVSSVALTGSLSTAFSATPYVDNLVVTTPAYLNTACSKYVAELTVDTGASTTYQVYGLNLHFTKTAP